MTDVSRDEFDALKAEVSGLTKRVKELHPAVEKHDGRLDDHAERIESLELKWAELRSGLARLVVEQHRLADALTSQGGSLELMARNVGRVLEILEPRKVIVEAEAENG